MEYHDGQLCLTFAELTGGDDPVISPATLRQNVRRKNILSVQRGGGEGVRALYAWCAIPEKYKRKWIMRNGDPEEAMRQAMVKETVRTDARAREFYETYTYADADGRECHLSGRLIAEYTANASVLGELARLEDRRRRSARQSNTGLKTTWAVIAESAEKMRAAYGHTLPRSEARLKAKLREFRKDGYACLVSGKLGNTSSVKITREFGRLLVALKRSRVPVYTDAQLFDKANEEAAARGWKPLKSVSGMRKWLYSPEVEQLWYDAVYGEQAARQRFNRKHRTELPTRRDSLWYGDGTRLNLYYRGDDGKTRTTCVYEVVDAMSEVLLGYHISDTEDYEAQYMAYRMAVMTSGHKPYEIVHDNQGGHNKLERTTGGLLSKICRIHRPTQPYNGESKTIESIFGRFQAQVLHKDWRFTGQNVTARKQSSRPNVEFVKANEKEGLYTLDELKDAYARARKEWNEMPHPATGERRIDMYLRSVNEETPEVTAYDMIDMFWVFTDREITFTDQGLTLTVKGKKRQYEVFSEPGVPDHAWRRRNTYRRFVVAYDPCDPGGIRLYTRAADGGLRFERTAEPYIVIHRAKQDQRGTADDAFIRQEQEANTADRVERTAEGYGIAYAHGTAPEQHGLNTPKPKGLPKEAQRELERRMALYEGDPQETELGRYTKHVSMADWMDALDGGTPADSREDDKAAMRRAASKM